MTFVRLEDALDGHPKVRKVGLEAFGLWTLALVHCGKYLTDGHVDDEWLAEKVPDRRKRVQLLDRLVSQGMLEPNGAGFHIHDFLEFNPTADEVRKRRAERAEAGRRGGLLAGRGRPKEGKSQS